MCGIAGIFNLKEPQPININSLRLMASSLAHRGPDESGAYIDEWTGLAHTRLSIFDLKDGIQPIHNEDKSIWIIFNGEIFNFPELKKDLIKKGHKFYTSTDTEVIIHLYEEKGIGCLNDFNGQFAFALWDSKKREFYIARDRIGIRPVHYTISNNQFYFASEIKAILTQNIKREIDTSTLDQVFTYWTTLPGKTIFKDIFELPPGHFIHLTPDNFRIEKFWELEFYPPQDQFNISRNDLIEQAEELLLDSIKIRLRADVQVGTYLSGGLDSSGITSIVAKKFNNNLHTFGIRFEEDIFDEGEYQNQMISYLGTNHTNLFASNSDIGLSFENVVWHSEKPLLRTAPVPLYLLAGIVRKNGYKVVLTGEGADEIFGGYNIFKEAKVRAFWAKQPHSKVRPLLLTKLYPYILQNPRVNATLKSFFGTDLEKPDDPFFSHIVRWKNTIKIKDFFIDEIKNEIALYNSFNDLSNLLPENFKSWDYLSKAQYLEIILFLSNYLLSSQGDRMAMANSVEIRLPFLDYRLIEFMSKVPSELKINGLNEKFLLKKIFKNYLPEKIIKRSKHPFRAPIKQSLLKRDKDNISSFQSVLDSLDSGFFDKKRVILLINKLNNSVAPNERDNMALTGIVSTEILHKKFIKEFPKQINPDFNFKIIINQKENNLVLTK